MAETDGVAPGSPRARLAVRPGGIRTPSDYLGGRRRHRIGLPGAWQLRPPWEAVWENVSPGTLRTQQLALTGTLRSGSIRLPHLQVGCSRGGTAFPALGASPRP